MTILCRRSDSYYVVAWCTVCECDNGSSSVSVGTYNNNLSKAAVYDNTATVAMTYHAARIIYRSSQILDSNTM